MADIRTLADLRAWVGPAGDALSDEDLMSGFARTIGVDPSAVADQFGWDPGTGSKNRERASASVDSYQANMWGVAGAASRAMGRDGEWADSRRRANEFQAQVAEGRARGLGAVQSYKDVHGFGDAADYVVGLGIQSAPYAAEALAGGIVGRAAVGGASRALASAGGAVAASYPSSVGDILANQRDQNGGEDLAAAMVGGVPYSLLNAGLGVEGRLAQGRLARSGIKALDDMAGAGGVAARTGASVVRTGLEEGVSEVGQELVNQGFGRMAVDPNETLFNDKANDRYMESFVGGAALGGAFGGAAGGWRRSAGYQPQVNDTPGESTDLLNAEPPAPPVPPPFQPVPTQQWIDQQLGVGQSHTPPNYEQQFTAAANEPTGRYITTDPQTQTETAEDAGRATALYSGELALQVAIDQAAKEFAARRQRAQDTLVENNAIKVPNQVVKLYHDMEVLRESGKLDEETFVGFAGAIKEALKIEDRKAINDVRKEVEKLKAEGANGQQPVVAAPAAVAAPAGAAGGAQPVGSVGAVGPVAADAGRGRAEPAAEAAGSSAAPGPVEPGPVVGNDALTAVEAPVVGTPKPDVPVKTKKARKVATPAAAPGVQTVTAPVSEASTEAAPAAVTPTPEPAKVEVAQKPDYSKYEGRAVEIDVPVSEGKSVRRKVKNARAVLEEADTRADKFDALVRCLRGE